MTMTPLEWAGLLPWASVAELAGVSGVNRSTVSRYLTEWQDEGLAVVQDGGRLLRPRKRVLLSSLGLVKAFPNQPERGHQRWPTYFNSYAGAELLWSRLPFIEIAYPLAPVALMDKGASWAHDGRPRRLLSWRWVRHAELIWAVGTYEDNVKLFFCWVGKSITEPMLRFRYRQRFQDLKHLVLRSEVDALHYRGDGFVEPLEPDVDPGPQPSGWVVVTQDAWGAQLAAAVLPETGYIRDNAFLYAVGPAGGPRIYVGRAQPAPEDDVRDKYEEVVIGKPEDLCE